VRSSCRGRVVIFSCSSFLRDLSVRTGNSEDVENLKKLFRDYLQFEVQVYSDRNKEVSFSGCNLCTICSAIHYCGLLVTVYKVDGIGVWTGLWCAIFEYGNLDFN